MAASLIPSGTQPVPQPRETEHSPVNVLLVDDQPGRLLTYRAILEPLGERLVDASSGTEALKRLMDEEFAVILLDVNMPGMDGFETASMIHQHPRFEKTPIIFVTAVNVTDMDRLRGYKLGAVDYVLVPVIPEILRSKVEVLSELFRKRRELQQANAELAEFNQSLVAERSRELEQFNESLRQANIELAARNAELRVEVAQRAKAEQRLRDADARKDEFLATLAHELRNPLAPLQNALSIRRLALGADEDGLQELMERQLALLVRMLDDLLDVARVTRGKMMLRRCVVALEDVVRNAVDTAQPLMTQFRHELSVQLPEHRVMLYADPARLAQVFANLLNNAAKYSEPGKPITLRAQWSPRGEVTVHVVDQGIGLSAQDAQTVFDPFRQIDTAVDRTHGGLGIGLTLVQRLVSLHGGRVAVSSPGQGQGATFSVVLPCGDGLVLPDVPAAEPVVEDSAPPVRVLVVDDNRDAADTLAALIRVLGHEVTQLYDPHEVEGEVDRFGPDLVFLDVGMPGRSGFDVARALRARPGGDALALVAVTGWGQPEDRRRSIEAGFDEHLVKPPELDAVRRLCRRAPAESAATPATPATGQATPGSTP
jgi:signal transduction histidine kinase